MYYRSNQSAKAGPSERDSSPRKKHDVGLSDKERIFVHALRNLFDPKGKSKANVLQSPKGIVSKPPRSSDDRDITQRRQTGQVKNKREKKVKRQYANEHLPPVSVIPRKWVHPANKRLRRKAGKILESEKPGSAAKQSVGYKSSKGPAGGGSPPLVDVSRSIPVSTSSAAKHKSPSRIRRAEMRAKSLARGVIVGAGRSKPTSLKQDPAVKREARENKRLGGAIDRLGEYVHPADELTVVTAFGGADALRELCKFERRRERMVFPSVVYAGDARGSKGEATYYVYPDGRVLSHFENCVGVVKVFHTRKTTRDYTKVTKGMRGVTLQKPRQFPALKAALAKELSAEAKRLDKGKSAKKVKSPSQVRRLKRRAEGRSSEVAVPAESAGVQATVADIDVKIPFTSDAGKCLDGVETQLRLWEEALAKFREGELSDKDIAKITMTTGKSMGHMMNLLRKAAKDVILESAVGLAMVPP